MKATRRHELQQNSLDAELGKGVNWIKTHGARTLWATVAVVAIGLVVFSFFNSAWVKKEQIRAKYFNTVGRPGGIVKDEMLETLLELTEQTTIKSIAADSCVEVANVYFQRMRLAEDAQQRSDFQLQAKEYYNKAIQEFPNQPLAAAKAHFGLAILAENRAALAEDPAQRKLAVEAARAEYELVIETKGIQGQAVLDLARMSLESLTALAEPVKMANIPSAENSVEASPAKLGE